MRLTEASAIDPAFDELLASRTVAYKVALAHAVGGATAGLLLSQLWYWSHHAPEGRDGWFYKTMDDITEETALTRSEQMTARKKLVELGVLEEERRGLPARMWFRLNREGVYLLMRNYAENKFAGNRKLDCRKSKTVVPQPANKTEQNLQSIIEHQTTAEITQKTTAAERPEDLFSSDASVAAADPDLKYSERVSDLILRLATAGLNRADAERLAASQPDECCRQLEYLAFVSSFKSSRGAYLRSAIEQGFAPPVGWVEAQRTATKRKTQTAVSEAQREGDRVAEAQRFALEAEKRRLQTEEPERWEQIVADAEAQLPPPLRGKTAHVAYSGALNGQIERLIEGIT